MLSSIPLCLLCALEPQPDYQKLTAAAKFSLAEAVRKGLTLPEASGGVPVQAELEEDLGKVVYSLDIAIGTKVRSMLLDARDGSVLENDLDDEDHSAVAAAARIPLLRAIEAAQGTSDGSPVFAMLALRDGKPEVRVRLFGGGKLKTVTLDAAVGAVTGAADPGQDTGDREFTDQFAEDKRDFASTGRNPFFVLEPGYTLVLEGMKGDQEARITIKVLDQTKQIDGVDARAVEEREEVGGQLAEVTLDYFVISRRTNNVYYFGEEVDVYEDGKLVSHEGAWLSGENGARYGLFLPATPCIGARYYQEVAPGIAMDRAEIMSTTDEFECPAGRFSGVLRTEETTPLERGEREAKRYARGVGLLFDGGLRLSSYGASAK